MTVIIATVAIAAAFAAAILRRIDARDDVEVVVGAPSFNALEVRDKAARPSERANERLVGDGSNQRARARLARSRGATSATHERSDTNLTINCREFDNNVK